MKVLSDCLQVDVKIDAVRLEDPAHRSEPLTPTQAWTFNRRLRVQSESDLDHAIALVALVAQAKRFLGG